MFRRIIVKERSLVCRAAWNFIHRVALAASDRSSDLRYSLLRREALRRDKGIMAFSRTPLRRLNRLLLDPRIDFGAASSAGVVKPPTGGSRSVGVASSASISPAFSPSSPAAAAAVATAATAASSTDGPGLMHVDLPADDPRTVHVATVLQLQDGDAIRTGGRATPLAH